MESSSRPHNCIVGVSQHLQQTNMARRMNVAVELDRWVCERRGRSGGTLFGSQKHANPSGKHTRFGRVYAQERAGTTGAIFVCLQFFRVTFSVTPHGSLPHAIVRSPNPILDMSTSAAESKAHKTDHVRYLGSGSAGLKNNAVVSWLLYTSGLKHQA